MRNLRSTPASPTRVRRAFAFLFAALGLGACVWYGESWLTFPDYSRAQIEKMAQVNFLVALEHDPPSAPLDKAATATRLAQERRRIVAEIDHRRKNIMAGLAAGLILLVIGAGQWLMSRVRASGTAPEPPQATGPHDR